MKCFEITGQGYTRREWHEIMVIQAHGWTARGYCAPEVKYIIGFLQVILYPGSSDPPEKIFNIFASENEGHTIINYYDTLG